MPIRYLTAGESHGPQLTAIVEGVPAGLTLDIDQINHQLARRQRGYGAGPRMKLEQDEIEITSGLMAGITTGAPIAFTIQNRNHSQWRGKAVDPLTTPRPGHSDLVGAIKYGYRDLRPPLERSSARETAARVAVGAICQQFLADFDIRFGGYVTAIGEVSAEISESDLLKRFEIAEQNEVRCPDSESAAHMLAAIEQAIKNKNTLGGLIEVFALGVPPGLGSYVQWDRKLDARLAAAVVSVQAIKGVEFGEAFANSARPGTEAQDAILLGENGELLRTTNRAGGIEAGISNGQPILLRAAMKPIATTLTPQQTVDLATGQQVDTQYERSDFCPVPRAVAILEAVVAIEIANALLEKVGGDSLEEIAPRVVALRRARLDDIPMDDQPHTWWPDE